MRVFVGLNCPDIYWYELVCPICKAKADELNPRPCKLCGAQLKQEFTREMYE